MSRVHVVNVRGYRLLRLWPDYSTDSVPVFALVYDMDRLGYPPEVLTADGTLLHATYGGYVGAIIAPHQGLINVDGAVFASVADFVKAYTKDPATYADALTACSGLPTDLLGPYLKDSRNA